MGSVSPIVQGRVVLNAPRVGGRLNNQGSSGGVLPLASWDTHVHVFDASIGPYAPSRSYTPPQATLAQLTQFGASLIQTPQTPNLVIVQPSPYRTDNRVLLSTLQSLQDISVRQCRGIAVVDIHNVTDEELWGMHNLGVRGLRLNLQADGHKVDIVTLSSLLTDTARRITRLPGWKLQMFCPAHVWDGRSRAGFSRILYASLTRHNLDLFETVNGLPVQIIAAHTGGLLGVSKLPAGADGHQDPITQAGFKSLVELARRGRIIVKISGLYRSSSRTDSVYEDLEPIVRTLASHIPDQLIWASDWPHTGEGAHRVAKGVESYEPFRMIDNKAILKALRDWVGGEEAWMKMMVTNPARVFK